jgi:fused signal recognition particle receptor
MIGVNGSGKTTTIAKLAARFEEAGKRVVLVAADTFRAAAIEQLEVWGTRAGATVLTAQSGADPAATVFDGLSSRAAKAADVVIVDTAGRLQTQSNLMAELAKIHRVCGRLVPGAPHATLLVLDATTGQDGLSQAREFAAVAPATGIVLAKLDSSAKGGVALAIRRELDLPILFVGTGEALEDIAPFAAEPFVDALLGLNSTENAGEHNG